MTQFDIFYRAFCDYRKQTAEDKDCKIQRKVYKQNNPDGDKLEATRLICNIEEDWINEIEKGLVHVEKALREERQFIRSDGEVVPIAKAKRVSKASVAHLARHSNLIVHLPEKKGDTIVPDNIFIVEKLSDYTVYENRFLYMLLCYLRDFLNLRLEKIVEIGNTYRGTLTMSKNIQSKHGTLTYELKFFEERKDNPFPLSNPSSEPLIKKIQILASAVMSFLQTSLMIQVAQAPMIKPPIIKTNVLRMDNNFKGAVSLYEYITSYDKDGYTFEEVKKTYNPFSNEIGDEVTELISLSSFLTYQYGNELKPFFRRNYEVEEKRLKDEEGLKLLAQIKNLKRKVAEQGVGLEEYMLLLEKRNRLLETEHELLLNSSKVIEDLKNYVETLKLNVQDSIRHIKKLEQIIVSKENELAALNQKYIDDMAKKDAERLQVIETLNQQFRQKLEQTINSMKDDVSKVRTQLEQQIVEIKDGYVNQINTIHSTNANEKQQMMAKFQEEVSKLNGIINTAKSEKDKAILECNQKVESYSNELAQTQANAKEEITNLLEEKFLLSGQLHGLREKYNLILPEEDFTSEASFEQLEAELAAFKNLFRRKWKEAKQKIRTEVLTNIPPRQKLKDKKKTNVEDLKDSNISNEINETEESDI